MCVYIDIVCDFQKVHVVKKTYCIYTEAKRGKEKRDAKQKTEKQIEREREREKS